MEILKILVDKPEEFDLALRGSDVVPSLPSGNDIAVITKNGAMQSGAAAAVITWTCYVDGKPRRAQYSVSIKHLLALAVSLRGAYGEDGFPRCPGGT